MRIADGAIAINSADDSVHSNDTIAISGGTLNLASGDDGVHADTSLTISGGTIAINDEDRNCGFIGGLAA